MNHAGSPAAAAAPHDSRRRRLGPPRRGLLFQAGLSGGLALLLAAASAQAAGGPPPPAPELARRLGCFACHSLHGQGGKIALPLDGVGTRLTPAQLHLALSYPRKVHPGAKMPSYAYLPPEERRVLAEFLQSLK